MGVTQDHPNDKEQLPLLHSKPAYDTFQDRGGYTISPKGLAAMVSQSQKGFVQTYGGVNGLAQALGCFDVTYGIKSSNFDWKRQRTMYGENSLSLPPSPSYCALVFEAVQDVTILMLLVSAAISLILGLGIEKDYSQGWIEGTSILSSVMLVVNVTAFTDYSKAKAFRKQQEELEASKNVHVVRDGETVSKHPSDVVVGDIVRIAVGDIICADGVLVEGYDLSLDESALTGESERRKKGADIENEDPFLVSGTNVMAGTGKMLVVAVGKNSVQGSILARIREENPVESEAEAEEENISCLSSFFSFSRVSPDADLMEKLDGLALDIGKAGMLVAGSIFAVMTVRWYYVYIFTAGRSIDLAIDLKALLDIFITAVTILVVAVPEGLPLAVTLSLAVSMNRMMKDNNQVKYMESCETMGSATTICSDKTGTLTENRMTVMRIVLAGHEFAYTAGEPRATCLADKVDMDPEIVKVLCESICLNSASTSFAEQQPDKKWKYSGNPTECALLQLAVQLGGDIKETRASFREPNSKLDWGVHCNPFSSERKLMSWIVKERSNGAYRMYVKGAPQQVVDAATSILLPGGAIETMTDAWVTKINEIIESFQSRGMRTLAISYADIVGQATDWHLVKEDHTTLLAVVGIEDPLRPTVPGAIETCRKAGIDVRMCTGDALSTAIAIARQCNILRPSDIDPRTNLPKKNFAMTGAEFDERVHRKDPSKPKVVRRTVNPETGEACEGLAEAFSYDSNGNKILDLRAFDEIWPTLRVLARCQPEDKLTLVRGIQRSKVFRDSHRCADLYHEHGISIFPDYQVVAVTGDGTNDAPALKSANVGFAMGIVGTETAKQACDIILMDDNFSSIVRAVLWGRNVFDSISKFIQFQLTVNFVAISLAVFGAFYYSLSPLSAVQMLWVNMIMDSLASLALATEPPTDDLLDRPPYGKKRNVISRIMLFNIFGQGIYQIIVLLVVLLWPQFIQTTPPVEYEPRQGSRHWTLFFNVFVQLQLFNELNSRKLQTVHKLRTTYHEWNVFEGITRNKMFVSIVCSTFILQILLVQYGGSAVGVISGGLNIHDWIFCLATGAFSLLCQILINIILLASERPVKTVRVPRRHVLAPHSSWTRIRENLEYGRVYARAFGLSLNTALRVKARNKIPPLSHKVQTSNSFLVHRYAKETLVSEFPSHNSKIKK